MFLRKREIRRNEATSHGHVCPDLGGPIRQRTKALAGGMILLLATAGCDQRAPEGGAATRPSGGEERAAQAQPKAETEKAVGETLSVGYTSYCVWRAWYSDRLSSNQFLDRRANAKWFFIDLTVRNDDAKARTVPPFKLVDENGAEYESSPEASMIESAIGVLETLNPSVSKRGLVVFDVPQNHQYRLKVSGGYWSAADGFIRLGPPPPTADAGDGDKPRKNGAQPHKAAPQHGDGDQRSPAPNPTTQPAGPTVGDYVLRSIYKVSDKPMARFVHAASGKKFDVRVGEALDRWQIAEIDYANKRVLLKDEASGETVTLDLRSPASP